MGQLNCVPHKFKPKEETEFHKCLPEQRYCPFPWRLRKPAFSLLLEKYVFPSPDYDHYMEQQNSEDASAIHNRFWLCDAKFPPNDDSVLFVTGEPLRQAFARREAAEPVKPASRVVMLKLTNERCCEELFSKCRSDVYPKLSMHPSGSYLALADDRVVQVEALHCDGGFITDLAGNDNRCLTECLTVKFAPDGHHVARLVLRYLDDARLNTLGFYIDKFELIVSTLEHGHLSSDKAVKLDNNVPQFFSQTMQDRAFYIESMDCRWSPDSKYIGVCSPRSCCIFSRKLKLHLYVNIVSDILKFHLFGTYGYKFDFDPRSAHALVAVSTNEKNGYVYFVNIKTKKLLKRSRETDSEIEYLQYHPFGKYVAAATQTFNIYLVDTSDGSFLHHLDMRELCSSITERYCMGPSFTSLTFTTTGEQLVTATSDAMVRVFQLPTAMSLYGFCKWTILTIVPKTKLKHLPLPPNIISELESDHTC